MLAGIPQSLDRQHPLFLHIQPFTRRCHDLQPGRARQEIDHQSYSVEQVLESNRGHRVPDHAPSRAVRVLENAAHIDAIITVSSGLIPIGLQTSSEVQIASDALRPLSGVVRSARMAAVSAILHSAWSA